MNYLRSKVSIYARRLSNQTRVIAMVKPTTKLFRQRFEEEVVLQSSSVIKNAVNGTGMVTFMKSQVPMEIIGTLMTSTMTLVNAVNVQVRRCSRSQNSKVLHIGQWIPQGGTVIQLTQETSKNFQACKAWVEVNKQLFDAVSAIFKQQQPQMFEKYRSIADKYELKLGPFSCVALNLNYGALMQHIDTKDVKDGYCWVLPWGNWDGGMLHFPELNVSVDSKPGDITGFLSAALVHEVTEYQGFRYSLTCFFTHQQNFLAPSNKEEWGVHDHKNESDKKRKKPKKE